MHDLSNLVSSNEILKKIRDICSENTYLVGGCIRDMLLGRNPSDFDIVTFCDVWPMARQIAGRFASTAFWMDRERGVARIALGGSGDTIDVSAPKGVDICSDLKQRDITINAIGFDVSTGDIIDPTGGINDLHHGIIRIISEENLCRDPLRVIRCLRFSVMLGFALTATTDTLLRKHADKVVTVSAERIKQEFLKALACHGGARFFSLMNRTGLIEQIFFHDSSFSSGYHVTYPALTMTCEMDGLIYDAPRLLPGIGQMFETQVEAGLTRAGNLRLATFLYGLGQSRDTGRNDGEAEIFCVTPDQNVHAAVESLRALKFSRSAINAEKRILSCQARASDIFTHDDMGMSDLHRLCEEAYPYLPEVLLLATASVFMSSGEKYTCIERMGRAWSYHKNTYEKHRKAPLITGDDVMQTLGVSPGPAVGKALRTVESARAQGLVLSRDEALDYLLTITI